MARQIPFNYHKWLLAALIPGIVLWVLAYAPLMPPPPPGLDRVDPMGAYLNGVFPDAPPTGTGPGAYELENAFPLLTFVDPLKIVEVPGQAQMMVLGKNGHIWSFDKTPTAAQKTLVLDISARTLIEGDGGALGMALHPEFGQAGSPHRGYLYVWYRYAPILQTITGPNPQGGEQYGYLRLSRFTLEDGAATINPASEYVLIQQFDRNGWHNGGDMFFGPDGFLYVSVGDEGSGDDGYNVTQRLDYCLFGGILRLDVDQRGGNISHPIRRQPQTQSPPPPGWPGSFTQGYFIPNDNPWQDENGGVLEEFYAIGLRSPHRIAWDDPTGDIWVGDVGQGTREEVDIVHKGDNLQWPFREGTIAGAKPQPIPLIGTSRGPVYNYPRDQGTCVIGGFVYRGSKFPDLQGRYLFGDHTTLNVYTLTPDPAGTPIINPMLNVPYGTGQGDKAGISAFGTDSDGNIYLLKLNGTGLDGGLIYQLRSKAPVADPPARLSELGVFTDMASLTPVPGILPYGVNAPLWSDRAAKYRWIALPQDGTFNDAWEKVNFRTEDYWTFPAGTVFIKHFELPVDEAQPEVIRRLETRFFVVTAEGAYGLTYKWNPEGTEAYLLTGADTLTHQVARADGSLYAQTWDFPSRQQCMTCHNANAGYVLGVRTRQLNGDLAYPGGTTGNQLETWEHLGIFNQAIGDPAQLPSSAYISDAQATPEYRVRSYLDANCAFCHRPNGVEAAFDGRSLTALYDQNHIYTNAISHSSPQGVLIAPGDPNVSILYQRDNSTGADAMPPIAKNLRDPVYIAVLEGWITTLAPGLPPMIADGWVTLTARHSGKVAGVDQASQEAGTPVVQAAADGSDHQQWHFQHIGGGKYRIMAAHSLMALSLEDWRPGRGAAVIQAPWRGQQHQLWYLRTAPNGAFYIVSAYNGLLLDVFSSQTGDGAALIAWTETQGTNQQWTLLPADGPACGYERTVYLSDLSWTGTPENGWGPVSRDRSNGEQEAGGNPITLDGQVYAKGLGVHAYSRITYEIGGRHDRFVSRVGLDDETFGNGSVQFEVWGDGTLLYSSPRLTGADPALDLDIPVRGVQRLVLVVQEGGDGNGYDHADWADARLITCEPPLAPAAITVYPNPSDDTRTLWVEYIQPEHVALNLTMFDAQGRSVYVRHVAEETRQGLLQIPLEGLRAGVYILRVSGPDWTEVRKVVVQ